MANNTEPISETNAVVYTPEKLEMIKKMFAPNLTKDEFNVFMELSNLYNLNPVKHEIWAVKYGGQAAQIFAGRDGFLSIAHRTGQFDGMNTRPNFDEKGRLVSATCTVWRKDTTHPFEKTVWLSEYDTHRSLWASKPITMLSKVVESQVLRMAFNVSGLYDSSEMGIDYPLKIEPKDTEIQSTPAKYSVKDDELSNSYTQSQFESILANYKEHGWSTDVIESAQIITGFYNKKIIDDDFASRKAKETN